MNVLGIDTSCDDTAVAIVAGGRIVLSSVISSQTGLHAATGGVVPEVASRRHLDDICPALMRALDEAGLGLKKIDAVAATVGPGLAGSLMVGYNLARSLAWASDKPFIAVNHLEGHIYSAWLAEDDAPPPPPAFPVLILIVSGGHTELVMMAGHGRYGRLGGTRDDAAGEAFDKVGRLLGLPYPGGPAIQAAAERALGRGAIALPRAWLRGNDDFSFSGLKTAVLHLTQAHADEQPDRTEAGSIAPAIEQTAPGAANADGWVNAVAAGFQDSVADVLATKTAAAARRQRVASVVLCGGVAANSAIKARLRAALPDGLPLYVPRPAFCTDNGAMIAAAAYYRLDTAVDPAHSPDVSPGLALPL